MPMRVLAIGAGGVGTSAALIAARRDFFQTWIVADYDSARVTTLVNRGGDQRFEGLTIDASNSSSIVDVVRTFGITHIVNMLDPRFVMPIFDAAQAANVHYMDTAMSLSQPHPNDPYRRPGKMLGDDQFVRSELWAERGLLALCGMGVEPGLADVFARYAADHLFSRITEIGVRDGSNLTVAGHAFAPTFSIWTTIEECLNPPIIWERGEGWYTTEPFSGSEFFDFPEGIGMVECVNVEHEEVVLVPRWIACDKVTFKYGLGEEFINVLKTLHKLGLDRTAPVKVRGREVSPRDVVAACLPDPASLGDLMIGKTCAGTCVTGTGLDGEPREVYIYNVVDNEWSMRNYGTQAVTWQTAMNPVIALELLANEMWTGVGVLGPEALDPVPFLDMMADEYGQEWTIREDRAIREST